MAEIALGEKRIEGSAYVPGVEGVEVNVIEKWRDGIFILLVISFVLTVVFMPDDVLVGNINLNLKWAIYFMIIILTIRLSLVRFLEYERGVVFRVGKFHRIVGPCVEVIPPIVERFIRRDTRLKVYNIDPQEVVTKDKIRFMIASEIFMYVSNPKDSVINVDDYEKAVLSYVNSALTHVGGDSTSDYIVAHMNDISEMLEHSIEHMSTAPGKEWGVIVPKIKLAFIQFPDEVQSAMHKRVAAGQLKLAAHEKAEATKIEIDAVREAGGKLTDPAITYLYLEALDKMAGGKATKIVLPLEISKIAESITKRTGAMMSAPDTTSPQDVSLPPDLIQGYIESAEKYDKRLKGIESKLTVDGRKEKTERGVEVGDEGEEIGIGVGDERKEIGRGVGDERKEKGRGVGDERKEKEGEDGGKARPRRGEIDLKRLRKGGVEVKPPGENEPPGELDEYRKRIKEIKKRIGID